VHEQSSSDSDSDSDLDTGCPPNIGPFGTFADAENVFKEFATSKLFTVAIRRSRLDEVTGLQSKNLRSNLAILNQLERKFNLKTKKILAMYFIGNYL
jgi:hypothetical protein